MSNRRATSPRSKVHAEPLEANLLLASDHRGRPCSRCTTNWMLEKYDYRSPAQVRRDLVGLDAAA